MSKLEQFVKDNREDFDKFEPGPVVWHNIQQQLKRPTEKKGILISIKAIRWSAAAAIIIMLGVGAYLYLQNKKAVIPIAQAPRENSTKPTNPVKENVGVAPHDTLQEQRNINNPKDEPGLAQKESNDENEELYHYARLIELKQNEITKIKKDEPLLYQKFAGDITKLDSTFHQLKKQLPSNPNREQILEAMIRNLKLQEAVLNQQLNIIKKINQTKKVEYEKAYKSI
jgi:hypothetical protein